MNESYDLNTGTEAKPIRCELIGTRQRACWSEHTNPAGHAARLEAQEQPHVAVLQLHVQLAAGLFELSMDELEGQHCPRLRHAGVT